MIKSTIRIDELTLIHDRTILVKKNQFFTIDIDLDGVLLKASFIFVDNEGNSNELAWNVSNKVINFRFNAWNDTLGTCILEPFEVAQVEGKPVYFQFAQRLIGNANLLHVFVLEGVNRV